MPRRPANLKKMTAAVARWIAEAQGRADGAQALSRRADWVRDQLAILGREDLEAPAHLVGLTAADLIAAEGHLRSGAVTPKPSVKMVALPPLPSRKLARVLGIGELSRALHITRAGDGFDLRLERWFIDNRGEKDADSELISHHAALPEAEAAMAAYGAQREAA